MLGQMCGVCQRGLVSGMGCGDGGGLGGGGFSRLHAHTRTHTHGAPLLTFNFLALPLLPLLPLTPLSLCLTKSIQVSQGSMLCARSVLGP